MEEYPGIVNGITTVGNGQLDGVCAGHWIPGGRQQSRVPIGLGIVNGVEDKVVCVTDAVDRVDAHWGGSVGYQRNVLAIQDESKGIIESGINKLKVFLGCEDIVEIDLRRELRCLRWTRELEFNDARVICSET